MNKKTFCTLLLLGIVSFIMSSCGQGPGGGVGEGNTVMLSAEIQDGKSTTAFSSVGAPPFTTFDVISFTVNSTPFTTTSGIQASPVQITGQRISYTPLADSNGAASPPLPSMSEAASAVITPGGKLNIDVIVVGPITKQYLYNNYLSALSAGVVYSYAVAVDFIGVEINTGTNVTCRGTGNIYIAQ